MDYKEMNTEFDVEFEECVARKGAGTTDYMELTNKPKINNVELEGNKTSEELGLQNELVNGVNIKTINSQSVLGSGNINIEFPKETDPIYNSEKHLLALKTELPTDNTDLTNGAGYQTEEEVQTTIEEALGNITSISYSVVEELPTIGEPGIIYLVDNDGEHNNIYDEYIYVEGKFDKIGTTEVDLSNYVEKAELEDKIDVIIPYKASYTDEEKIKYGVKIFSCFDSTYTMLKPLYISISGLLVPYTGRVNGDVLSFGTTITDVTNGVHFIDYIMSINSETKTLESITTEPTIELVDDEELQQKQDKLVSGMNIKTINGSSVLGEGNIEIKKDVIVLQASTENVIDFNDLLQPGYYLVKGVNKNTALNSPITDEGTYDIPLQVEKAVLPNGEANYEQLTEGGVLYRSYTNGEWYDWGNITDDLYQMTKAYTDTKYKDSTEYTDAKITQVNNSIENSKTKFTSNSFTADLADHLYAISLTFTPDLVIIYAPYNNRSPISVQNTASKDYAIPRILTRSLECVHEGKEQGKIVTNGFTFRTPEGDLSALSGYAIHYVAIKF